MHDPQSRDFHLYVKGNPHTLVDRTLLADGLKRVDYSEDWCKAPNDWCATAIVDTNRESCTYVRRDTVVLGEVVEYGVDGYTVEHENIETGEVTTRTIHDSLMVEQLKEENWWVES
jgi:hypothetical protein